MVEDVFGPVVWIRPAERNASWTFVVVMGTLSGIAVMVMALAD